MKGGVSPYRSKGGGGLTGDPQTSTEIGCLPTMNSLNHPNLLSSFSVYEGEEMDG